MKPFLISLALNIALMCGLMVFIHQNADMKNEQPTRSRSLRDYSPKSDHEGFNEDIENRPHAHPRPLPHADVDVDAHESFPSAIIKKTDLDVSFSKISGWKFLFDGISFGMYQTKFHRKEISNPKSC